MAVWGLAGCSCLVISVIVVITHCLSGCLPIIISVGLPDLCFPLAIYSSFWWTDMSVCLSLSVCPPIWTALHKGSQNYQLPIRTLSWKGQNKSSLTAAVTSKKRQHKIFLTLSDAGQYLDQPMYTITWQQSHSRSMFHYWEQPVFVLSWCWKHPAKLLHH